MFGLFALTTELNFTLREAHLRVPGRALVMQHFLTQSISIAT